jgi:alpha-D-xyloside xylohydrolase
MAKFTDICYQAMNEIWGQGNFYNFARSVFDRSRSRTAVWNGDSQADWTGLAYSVASGIRAGLLGFSQWGSDTGGYLRTNSTPSEELFARWMHFSAFSPMYEILIGPNHNPLYDYSPRLLAILKSTANLHTRLIPYIRSYTYQASQTGLPVMRALFLEYPGDDAIFETADAYAFGRELLVAPVVTAGGSRSVYFPKGHGKFIEFFNKTLVFAGGDTHNVTDLPLEAVPVYVREGAIVPTGDVYQGNAKWMGGWQPRIALDVFHSYAVSVSTFTYYRGREAQDGGGPGPATITLTTDAARRSVSIGYDDLGVEGVLNIWYKGGPRNETRMQSVTLPSGGRAQVLRIDGLGSVFE